MASAAGPPSPSSSSSSGGGTVTEEHVLRMLRISGYSSDEALALTSRLTFPASLDDVMAVFAPIGIHLDFLTDRMGGSP